MKCVAFIPVRKDSKSIVLKNFKKFCGKPLIYWVAEAASRVKEIDEVIIATDYEKTTDIISKYSFNDKVTIYYRDKENAQDHSSTESVVLEYINKSSLSPNDCFILIQATSPLLTHKYLEEGLLIFKDKKYDSVLSCVNSKRFFWKKDGTPINYNPNHRPRRQDFEGWYMENGAFYINTVKNILDHQNRISGKIGISVMPEYTAVELDEEEDWIIAEKLMKKYINKTKSRKKIKLFISDVDGVLTDAGMYYSDKGEVLKKFNTHDGMGFELLRKKGIKTGIITSENTEIVKKRAEKLKINYVYLGKKHNGKINAAMEICKKEGVTLEEVAYIGDDINCLELLNSVGVAACPENATKKIKNITNIIHLDKKGGEGVVREFIDLILQDNLYK